MPVPLRRGSLGARAERIAYRARLVLDPMCFWRRCITCASQSPTISRRGGRTTYAMPASIIASWAPCRSCCEPETRLRANASAVRSRRYVRIGKGPSRGCLYDGIVPTGAEGSDAGELLLLAPQFTPATDLTPTSASAVLAGFARSGELRAKRPVVPPHRGTGRVHSGMPRARRPEECASVQAGQGREA